MWKRWFDLKRTPKYQQQKNGSEQIKYGPTFLRKEKPILNKNGRKLETEAKTFVLFSLSPKHTPSHTHTHPPSHTHTHTFFSISCKKCRIIDLCSHPKILLFSHCCNLLHLQLCILLLKTKLNLYRTTWLTNHYLKFYVRLLTQFILIRILPCLSFLSISVSSHSLLFLSPFLCLFI